MGCLCKGLALALILVMIVPCLSLLVVKPANAQSSTPASSVSTLTPLVPKFIVQVVKTSKVPETYWLNPALGKNNSIPTDNNANYTIELTVKNQPFLSPFTEDGQIVFLFYDVRMKEDYSENWTDAYATTDSYPTPTNSAYAVIPFPLEVSEESQPYSYNIESYYNYYDNPGVYYATLNGISAGDQVDFQVETFIGYIHRDAIPLSPWYFEGVSSGWSETQTVTIPQISPSASPSPMSASTPSVPELSWLVIVPLLLSVFSVAVILRPRKTADLKQ